MPWTKKKPREGHVMGVASITYTQAHEKALEDHLSQFILERQEATTSNPVDTHTTTTTTMYLTGWEISDQYTLVQHVNSIACYPQNSHLYCKLLTPWIWELIVPKARYSHGPFILHKFPIHTAQVPKTTVVSWTCLIENHYC